MPYDPHPPQLYDSGGPQSIEDLILLVSARRLQRYGFPTKCVHVMASTAYVQSMQRFDLQVHSGGSVQQAGEAGGDIETFTLVVGVILRLNIDQYGRSESIMTKDSSNLNHLVNGVRQALQNWYPWVYVAEDAYTTERRLLTASGFKWISTSGPLSYDDLPHLVSVDVSFQATLARRQKPWNEDTDYPEWQWQGVQ